MDRPVAQAILERLHAAQNDMYAGGDIRPVRALLTDDVEWHVPGANAIAGAYRGIDEVVSYFRRRRELAANTLRLHPGELLLGEGEHIASLTDGSAHIGGEEHRWSTVGLYRIREGRIAGCWLLPLDQAAFDRAWSGPERGGPERVIAGEPVLILTGAPGAGKTTVAKALISRYERAVHLECDRFFHLVAAGYVEPWRPESHAQNEVVMSIVARAAVSFADAQYFTVIDGIVSPRWFLGPLRDALAA